MTFNIAYEPSDDILFEQLKNNRSKEMVKKMNSKITAQELLDNI